MSNKLKVNWSQLKRLSENTLQNSQDFENARNNFQEIINSITECWEGIDADNFITNCNGYLDLMKNDTAYFETLGQYFDAGSKTYNKVVEDNYQKMQKLTQKLSDSEEEFNLYSEAQADIASRMAGGSNGNY